MQDGATTEAPTTQAAQARVGSVSEGIDKIQETGGSFVASIPTILFGLVIFAAFILLGMGIKYGIRWYGRKKRRNYNLILAVGRIAQGIAFIVGLLVATVITFPNFTPTNALASLGFGSVALAFAARDILQNYIAGILLLVTQPFRLGDQIVFKEFEGTVQDIQARATFIRTYDGRRAVIPNAELFTNSVLVNTAFEMRRIEYDVGIGYGDDIALAKRIMLQAMAADESAKDDPPPEVLVYQLGADNVILRARWWIDPPQRHESLDSRDTVLTAMKIKLTEAGIDLPFPTQMVLFHDQTDDNDGDRRRQREGWPANPNGDDPKPRPRTIPRDAGNKPDDI